MNCPDPTYTLPAPIRLTRGRLVVQALLMTLPLLSMTALTVAAPFAAGDGLPMVACAVAAQLDDAGIQASSP
jgi:hypothetical protein